MQKIWEEKNKLMLSLNRLNEGGQAERLFITEGNHGD